MVVVASKVAADIASKWGPAFTKAAVEDDLADFKSLFVSDEPVAVVLQNAEGTEMEFSIGESGATMTWQEFHEVTMTDLKAQEYAKTEAQCLGVLGDRMLIETGRFNKDGEVYAEAYALLTLNSEGKVTAFEAFTDPQAPSLLSAVSS